MIKEQMTKLLPISKWMVYKSYLKVIAKDGCEGVHKKSIEQLHENLPANLDKIWDHMTSGNYFPPSPADALSSGKRRGKKRLGVPLISDRIAQGVLKDFLEPILEKIFHRNSFGYRPGRNIHDAIGQCQENCMEYEWVIGVKIKDIPSHIGHHTILQLLQLYTQEKWILIYTERWLRAGIQREGGNIGEMPKGLSPAGIMSPVFANLYMHHIFDKWMNDYNGQNPFERYGDEIIIHCRHKEEAEIMLQNLTKRMKQNELELNPMMTKTVHSKNYLANNKYNNNSSTLLDYGIEHWLFKDHTGRKNWIDSFYGPGAGVISKLRTMLIMW
jgi:RNA-directed DNA polymerase